jgi:hypothetical protein
MAPRGGRLISSRQLEILRSPFNGAEAQTETRPAFNSGDFLNRNKNGGLPWMRTKILDGKEDHTAVRGPYDLRRNRKRLRHCSHTDVVTSPTLQLCHTVQSRNRKRLRHCSHTDVVTTPTLQLSHTVQSLNRKRLRHCSHTDVVTTPTLQLSHTVQSLNKSNYVQLHSIGQTLNTLVHSVSSQARLPSKYVI